MADILMVWQGGTCVFAGDSHKRIDDMAAAAQKRIGCKVFKRKKFYRKSGYSQVNGSLRLSTIQSAGLPYWVAWDQRSHCRLN